MNLAELTEEQLEALSQDLGRERDALRLDHLRVAHELRSRRLLSEKSPKGRETTTVTVHGVVVPASVAKL